MTEYVLVPVEPTEEMENAPVAFHDGLPVTARGCYKAMLAARPRQGWVKTSDRLPAREDADEDGYLWSGEPGLSFANHYHKALLYPYWMPKPRATPPEPPEEE